MFTELPRGDYDRVRTLLTPFDDEIEVTSVLDGNTRGVIFVDDIVSPQAILVWDRLAAFFIGGRPGDEAFAKGLRTWLDEEPLPQAQDFGIDALTLAYRPAIWAGALPGMLPDLRLTAASRNAYTHSGLPVPEQPIGGGVEIRRVDAELLACTGLGGLDWLRGWIDSYWHTAEDFLAKGIGAVALADGSTVVSLCVSVFTGGRFQEFGTATQPLFRGRGLSTAVTASCVAACLARAYVPVWHCWTDNLASDAVARKVGFTLRGHEQVYKLWVPHSHQRH